MSIEDIKKILEHLKFIFNTPISKILAVVGSIVMLLSFIEFPGLKITSRLGVFITGAILAVAGIAVFLFAPEEKRINKKVNIKKGLKLNLEQITVNLRVGRIQEVTNGDKTSAVVLSANTLSFVLVDDFTDEESALGAFFKKYHTNKISKVLKDIEEQLQRLGYQRNENGTYPLGTTIILPDEYDMPAKTIITVSSVRKEIQGIRADPPSICECIRQIFIVTADKKISKLYMPVLGSGHGGMDINEALYFMILTLKYYAKYYHHIKAVDIIILDEDVPKLKDPYRLQYLTLL